MSPTLEAGDRLVVVHGAGVAAGDLVVARLPGGVVAVKRVESIDAAGVWLASDNCGEGWASRTHGGPVAPSDVVAKVVGRLWPRPGRVPNL